MMLFAKRKPKKGVGGAYAPFFGIFPLRLKPERFLRFHRIINLDKSKAVLR